MQTEIAKILLTTSEAATLLGVHRNTVCRLNNRGVLKAYRICDRGDRRFFQEEVELLLKQMTEANSRRKNNQ
jgi:excisionase family DNA binding protein